MSARSTLEMVAALAAFGLIALAGEALHRLAGVRAEVTRALQHVADGVLSASLPAFLGFAQIAAVLVLLTGLVVLSRRFNVFRGIHDVSRRTWGEVFFPVGLLLLAVVVRAPAPFVYGALVMGVADGVASLVGTRFGRRHPRTGPWRKTRIGSAAFFLTCLCAGWGVLAAQDLSGPAIAAGSVSLSVLLTPIEATLAAGLDDLVLPIVAGLGMLVAIHVGG